MKEYSNHSDSFAQAWQEAFEGAEQAPSPQVWDNIHQTLAGGATASAMATIFDEAEMAPSGDVWDKVESTLAQDEAALYKSKMRRYQYVAAAAIALLLLLGGRTIYTGLNDNGPAMAEANEQLPSFEEISNAVLASTTTTMEATPYKAGASKCGVKGTAIPSYMEGVSNFGMIASVEDTPSASETSSGKDIHAVSYSEENRLPQALAFEPQMVLVSSEDDSERNSLLLNPLSSSQPIVADISQPMEDRMIYLDPTYVKRPAQTNESGRKSPLEGSFASFAMNGGGFNPNYQNQLSSNSSFDQSVGFVADGTQEAVEELEENMRGAGSVSAGIQVGFPLGRRWMMYTGGGIGNYQVRGESKISFSLQQENSNAALPTTTSTYHLVRESFNNQNDQSDVDAYQVTENFQYVSVPLQVGYLALNKKVQVWLMGGVNADVFLRNTVVSEVFSHETLVVNANDPNSPYQPVVVSGVVGTDVSYQLSDHWSVSVQPTIRQAINSIAKDGEVFSGNPSFFDLGFRLKYHVQ
ncbi:MAG: outer membrane beta-barrel protein [Bacteroidota bacterium]